MPTNEIKFRNGLNRNKFICIRVQDADGEAKERIKWWINNAGELTELLDIWMRVLQVKSCASFFFTLNSTSFAQQLSAYASIFIYGLLVNILNELSWKFYLAKYVPIFNIVGTRQQCIWANTSPHTMKASNETFKQVSSVRLHLPTTLTECSRKVTVWSSLKYFCKLRKKYVGTFLEESF